MALPIKQSGPKFQVGVGTVGTGAAQQLTATPTEAIKGIYVKCTSGTIYVGPNANVTATNGYPLASAGDSVVEVAVDSPDKIWVIGGAAGQTYKWLAS
jgi:uncharacterized Zn-binding protein involved in type VI secretion